MKNRRLIYLLAGAAALLFTFLVLLPAAKKGPAPPPAVNAASARFVAGEGKVEAMPGLDVDVGSDLPGRIERLNFKEGDAVKKGDVIAVIASADVRARLEQAEAEEQAAKARLGETASGARAEEIAKATAALEAAIADEELERENAVRYRELYGQGLASKSQLDERERAVKVAAARAREALEARRLLEKGPKEETIRALENEVKRAGASVDYYRRLLEKMTIRSPIDGRMIKRYMDEGEIVYQEAPIATIADVERVWINADVDETDVGRVRVGDAAAVTSDAFPGKVFEGEVREISEYAGQRNVRPNNQAKNFDMKVIQVKVALKEKTPLRIGMTVDVRITPKAEGR